MKKTTLRSLFAAGALALGLTGAAQAQNFSFSCVTNNDAGDCAIAEAQLGLAVDTAESGFVKFIFTNTSQLASSITDIYFDWLNPADALAQGTIGNSAGVSFSWGASPGNLPGGNTLSPAMTSAELSADSDAPAMHNGVNAEDEWVSFRFATGSSNPLQDLFAGSLRIGVHVQGFDSEGSESLVAIAAPVPEPETYALMLAGLGIVGAMARRKRKQG
jgi:hypothetical protein